MYQSLPSPAGCHRLLEPGVTTTSTQTVLRPCSPPRTPTPAWTERFSQHLLKLVVLPSGPDTSSRSDSSTQPRAAQTFPPLTRRNGFLNRQGAMGGWGPGQRCRRFPPPSSFRPRRRARCELSQHPSWRPHLKITHAEGKQGERTHKQQANVSTHPRCANTQSWRRPHCLAPRRGQSVCVTRGSIGKNGDARKFYQLTLNCFLNFERSTIKSTGMAK